MEGRLGGMQRAPGVDAGLPLKKLDLFCGATVEQNTMSVVSHDVFVNALRLQLFTVQRFTRQSVEG